MFDRLFQLTITRDLVAAFDGRRLTFNVGEDGRDFRQVAANLTFEYRHLVMGLLERKALVELQVLLDMEASAQVLDANVVNVEIGPGGDGANAIEDVLAAAGARRGVDHNI